MGTIGGVARGADGSEPPKISKKVVKFHHEMSFFIDCELLCLEAGSSPCRSKIEDFLGGKNGLKIKLKVGYMIYQTAPTKH